MDDHIYSLVSPKKVARGIVCSKIAANWVKGDEYKKPIKPGNCFISLKQGRNLYEYKIKICSHTPL